MKRLLFLMMCFLSLATFSWADDLTPAMKGDFLGKVQAAVAAKDFKSFSALYCAKGTIDPVMKDQLDKFIHGLFDRICSMSSPEYKFTSAPSDLQTSFEHNGKTYQPNLQIVALLQVQDPNGKPNTPTGGTWRLPLGVDNGALEIVQTVIKN